MNENASKKWFLSIRNDCEMKLAYFCAEYKIIVHDKIENGILQETYLDSSEEAAEVELRAYDNIKGLQQQIKEFLTNIRNKIASKYPKHIFDTLWSILGKENCIPKILELDSRLNPPEYESTVNMINKLNELANNLSVVIQKLPELIEDGGKIYTIKYLPKERKLFINKKYLTIGSRKTRIDLLLRAFCKKPNYILKNPVYLGDIYELGEDDALIGKDKKAKQQYVSNGYIDLNNEVRTIVPNGEDLIVKDGRSFILNPKLK